MQTLRVPIARFKYNMRPFVDQAKAGAEVIITTAGADDFRLVPCISRQCPTGVSVPMDPKAYEGINLDEPAFKSWGQA
jgi:antitoxin (DNA-binding transcriptional repressor) of toxin-antitoxin stability system